MGSERCIEDEENLYLKGEEELLRGLVGLAEELKELYTTMRKRNIVLQLCRKHSQTVELQQSTTSSIILDRALALLNVLETELTEKASATIYKYTSVIQLLPQHMFVQWYSILVKEYQPPTLSRN